MDITCCRIGVAKDSEAKAEYLVCTNVFPAPELSKVAIKRGRKGGGPKKAVWTDWNTALSGITNNAVVSYFKEQIGDGRESYLRMRILHYLIAGKRRWFMSARKKNAYIWQRGRFDNDVKFWQHGLSKPDGVKPVKDGQCLRFFLNNESDFRYFHDAATKELLSRVWFGGTPEAELEEVEGNSIAE